jgi:transcriptional regulator with XRE-family HTH domain
MNNKERIASYLSQGLKPAQVASIVGCTPAYLSQLVKEAKENPEGEFALLLKEYSVKETEAFSEDKLLTNKYLSMEHKLLEQMEASMQFAELPAITAALRVVAERQEKRMTRLQAPTTPAHITNVVQITVPAHAIPSYSINANQEVIKIGDQNLAPMSADGVKGLFAQISMNKQLEEAKKAEEAKTIDAIMQEL